MEEQIFKFNPIIILTSLLPLVLLLFFIRILYKPSTKTKRPPSPYKLPIIGNLHQLGPLPHQNLRSLAKIHGPLMLLHFGSVPVLVVSSAEMAREITRTHDTIFANRPPFKAFKKLLYGCRDVSVSPYGEYWRQMKSIVVLQLLSNKRVQSFRTIREEETALFVEKVREASGAAVDLRTMFASFTNDGVCRAAFGRKYSESENGEKFLLAITNLMELAGVINIGDFIPWLDWIGRFNGFDKRLDETAKEMDRVFERLIEERQQARKDVKNEKNGEDFLDILLEIYNGETVDYSIERDSLKALLLDAFVGGTDTISTSLEWTMAELLRNPAVMTKLQSEVRGIVKEKEEIGDDDLEKMQYLKAVIKEALRCHPPVPLLVPRLSTQDVQINGVDISAGTVVMINVWAIGRDPISWDEPEKFKPERFVNSTVDFKGQDFEFIPFGAGRRGCPGISFATVVMELLLANLVQKFEWKLPNGVEGKDLDMDESPGISIHKAVPLLAIASNSL